MANCDLKAAFYFLWILMWIFSAESKVNVKRPSVRSQIPANVWKELAKINSTKDFIKHYVRRPMHESGRDKAFLKAVSTEAHFPNPNADHPVNGTDVLSKNVSETLFPTDSLDAGDEAAAPDDSGSEIVAGMLTVPDEGCQPRMAGVRLPKSEAPDIVFWPQCVPLHQCGGCCGHEMLECAAATVSRKEIYVMKVRYIPKDNSFEYQETETFTMDDHTSCECRCREKQHHCHKTKHIYDEDNCRCKCVNDYDALTCLSFQKWDDINCQCVCREEFDCHDDEYFNSFSCGCAKMAQFGQYSNVSNYPCAGKQCRAGYAAGLSKNGECECLQSNEWGDSAPAANSPNDNSNIQVPEQPQIETTPTTTTTTTRRPQRPRPRPTRRRMIPGSRGRKRREINPEDYLDKEDSNVIVPKQVKEKFLASKQLGLRATRRDMIPATHTGERMKINPEDNLDNVKEKTQSTFASKQPGLPATSRRGKRRNKY